MADDLWLIVGLGNPGADYGRNRHNIGFLFLDEVVSRIGAGNFGFQNALRGKRVRGRLNGVPALFLKPETYMNLSGQSVRAACSYFKILSQKTVICYDDVDIPFGNLRIRSQGSSGGHKGVASVIDHIGGRFVRLRLGIGPSAGRRAENLAGFVLSDFSSDELREMNRVFDRAYSALELVVSGRLDEAMNRFNRRRGSD